jgi:hypothetical protein
VGASRRGRFILRSTSLSSCRTRVKNSLTRFCIGARTANLKWFTLAEMIYSSARSQLSRLTASTIIDTTAFRARTELASDIRVRGDYNEKDSE